MKGEFCPCRRLLDSPFAKRMSRKGNTFGKDCLLLVISPTMLKVRHYVPLMNVEVIAAQVSELHFSRG
jgi:hypothetical protein